MNFRRDQFEVLPWRADALAPRSESFTAAWAGGSLAAMAGLALSGTAQANSSTMVVKALNPLVDLIQAASYPVCLVVLSAGFLLVMTGQRSRGLNLIKYASLGYLGMQFAPAIMQMLYEVGKSMRTTP